MTPLYPSGILTFLPWSFRPRKYDSGLPSAERESLPLPWATGRNRDITYLSQMPEPSIWLKRPQAHHGGFDMGED